MKDPPDSPPPVPPVGLWTAWVVITMVGPFLSMGAIALTKSEFIWTGINMAIFAGIIYFSVKISASFPKHDEWIAVGLSIGGALISFGIYFGACVVSM